MKISDKKKQLIFDDWENFRKSAGLDFIDMERIMDNHNFNWHGSKDIGSQKGVDLNIITWTGWNMDAINLEKEYAEKYDLKVGPTSLLLYLSSDGGLNLPIARSARKYKKLHWIPSAFFTESEYEKI